MELNSLTVRVTFQAFAQKCTITGTITSWYFKQDLCQVELFQG